MGHNFVDRRKKFVLLAALLALIAALNGCEKKDVQAAAPGGSSASRPAAPVVVASVEQRDVPVQIRAIGNVEAYQTVQVRSMVNGQIDKVLFKEGQDVRQGQLLFQLDKRPFEADLEKVIGTMRHDEATAAQSELQAKRYTELEQQGVISKEQADQFRAQAKADASGVYADKAAVDAARVQLAYTDIGAPIDARTGAVLIHKGNLVKANDTPYLVQLNQVAPIYVTFSIPETELAEVRQFAGTHQLRVFATPKGQNTSSAEGDLTFIDNGVDMTTGTVKLKATFSNKDRRLWPGEFADVTLNLSTRKNAILVPTKAVQTGQQGEYVYVVTAQNTAESRTVQAAGSYQNMTIVTAGVKPGEKVITEGLIRVAPNSKVVVEKSEEPAKANQVGSGQ